MILARKLRTALALYRRGDVATLAKLSTARVGGYLRANALVPPSAGRRARLLAETYNDRAEFSAVPIDTVDASRVRSEILFPFVRASFVDAAKTAALGPVETAVVADSLFRTWDFKRLDADLPAWRTVVRGTKFAGRFDQLACRVALRLGRLSEAAAWLDRLPGEDAASWLLRGDVLDAMGRMEGAGRAYERAVHRGACDPLIRLNSAFHLLKGGRFLDGLASWGVADALFEAYPLRPGRPGWSGESLDGKTLLVVFEHGLGDMIQFARFLPLVRRDHPGVDIVGSVPAPLVGLFSRSFAGLRFVPAGERDPPYHLYVSSVQLAAVLGADSLEPRGGYLDLGATRPRDLRGRLRVGVCWRGHPRQYEATRSIALEDFARLFAATELDFVVLLNTVTAPERAVLARHGNVSMPPIADFVDLGAAIAQCDLVVSVDTATVHVAGAGNRPVLLLSRPDSCWRWGPSGPHSPWYASVEVLRHDGDMDWNRMLDEVARRLRALSAPTAPPVEAAAV